MPLRSLLALVVTETSLLERPTESLTRTYVRVRIAGALEAPNSKGDRMQRLSDQVIDLRQNSAFLHDFIVRAVVRSYETAKEPAVPYWKTQIGALPDEPDIVIPALRRVEEIETDSIPDSPRAHWATFKNRGFELWLLVPRALLSEAHLRFTGIVDFLQPWWIEGNVLKFGEVRVA